MQRGQSKNFHLGGRTELYRGASSDTEGLGSGQVSLYYFCPGAVSSGILSLYGIAAHCGVRSGGGRNGGCGAQKAGFYAEEENGRLLFQILSNDTSRSVEELTEELSGAAEEGYFHTGGVDRLLKQTLGGGYRPDGQPAERRAGRCSGQLLPAAGAERIAGSRVL